MKKLSALIITLFIFALNTHAEDLATAIEAGKKKYMVCGACHQMDGKGMIGGTMKMAPNFADSNVAGAETAEAMVVAVLKGITKEDQTYMGMMTPLATQSDEDIADIVTYVRNQFTEKKDLTTAEQVKAWRKKYTDKEGMISRADLEKIVEETGTVKTDSAETSQEEKTEPTQETEEPNTEEKTEEKSTEE